MKKSIATTLMLGACLAGSHPQISLAQQSTLRNTVTAEAFATPNTAPAPVTAGAATAKQVDPNTYRIGPGDVLAIRVWKEDDASIAEAVVRADGKLTVPYVREIEASGLTPAELEQLLTTRLVKYIHNPDVTVLVKSVHSQRVYVTGAVKKEGPITLSSPLTVLEALMEAGGLTDYAKKKKIYVLRTENAKQTRLPFNYSEVIKGEQSGQNVRLQPGDVIVVPQ